MSRPQPPPPELEDPDDTYDDCSSSTPAVEEKEQKKAAGKVSELPPPPLPSGNKRREPPPVPPSSEPPLPPPPKADLPAIPMSIPPTVPDRRPSNSELPPPPLPGTLPPPPLPGSNPPPLPGRVAPAAPRVPQLRKPFMDREEDFENVYLGRWDCVSESDKELAFKRGDLIHVLSRDFDAERWWVGELAGKVGLVPKEYLCLAFELVA